MKRVCSCELIHIHQGRFAEEEGIKYRQFIREMSIFFGTGRVERNEYELVAPRQIIQINGSPVQNIWDTPVHCPHQAGSETQPVEVSSQSERYRMGLNQTDSGVSSEMFGIGSGFPSAMARARR